MGKQMIPPQDYFWLGLALGIFGSLIILIAYLYQREVNLLARPSLPAGLPPKITRLRLAIPILIVLRAAERENKKLGFAELHKRLRAYGAPEKIELTSRTIKRYLQPKGFVDTETKDAAWRGRERNFVWLTDRGRDASIALEPVFFPNVIAYLQREN
jgi:hypothetical protein